MIRLAIVLFAISTAAFGQLRPKGSAEQIKADLIKIEREIGRANLECDYKYFDRVEAEDFFFTNAAGGTSDKKADMAGEKDCQKHPDFRYDVDETRVALYGVTAVVTGRVTVSGKNKEGAAFARRSRFTDVFVLRDGRWQLVAGQSTRISEPKKS